jgi:hypothetical protein
MSKVRRDGLTLKTGKIGRCNVLRQQLLMPGEKMNMRINGSVRLESLRERDVMRIHGHLATFMTPVRWLQSDFPDYIKEGPDTAKTIDTVAVNDFSKYGVGTGRQEDTSTINMCKWFQDAPLRVYNEWYKFPDKVDSTTWDDEGEIAVPLSAAWTRTRNDNLPSDTDDYTLATTAADITVQDIAQIQARYRSAMKRDVLAFNRWMELVKQTWQGADPSREVDQVPIMLSQAEIGVQPRDLPATDGSSLGTWQSLYDFNIDHSINGIIAPEHCIITTILVVRFPPITETVMPLAIPGNLEWWEATADPERIGSEQPVSVKFEELFADGNSSSMGYHPSGWQWRCGHDVIDDKIYRRNSFPYMNVPSTFSQTKDATRIKEAFRSQSLGDYMVDAYFTEESYQPIGTALESYFSGMIDEAENVEKTSDQFPHQGKQL